MSSLSSHLRNHNLQSSQKPGFAPTDVCYILFRLQTMYKSSRLDSVLKSIQVTGTYEHTAPELAFGAQLAWRNASRCIGRISWSNLQVLNLNAIIDFPFFHYFPTRISID